MKNNTYNHKIIAKAITFAANSHCGYFRKGTEIPYIVHPMEAAVIVSTMTNDPEVIAAAVLHDVVEDTSVSINDLRKEFSNTSRDDSLIKLENIKKCSKKLF